MENEIDGRWNWWGLIPTLEEITEEEEADGTDNK
tara:strand:+ start:238 stop:339 length:102 start_codon:yes stop_codon:yes gene_type:complete